MIDKKRGTGKRVLVIVIIIVFFLAVYFTFFFSYKCDDIRCFQSHQERCSRTEFINDLDYATWLYQIKGEKDNKCNIEVSVLKMKKGELDKLNLEGKSMNCYLALGDTSPPEADISVCHGSLKEELQNLIIQKLHSYIVENIGEISEELEKIV